MKVVKNKTTERGREFWGHVEAISAQVSGNRPMLPLGDRSHHFETDAVIGAIGENATDYVKAQIEGHLCLMTSGERYALYRAIKSLILAAPSENEVAHPKAGE